MTFQEVVRRPAYQQVSEQLREAILGGVLAPGSELPAERELCERFGVARTTVREALRALQAQGLVVAASPTAPLRVVTPEGLAEGPARDALTHLLALGQVGLDDLVGLRLALEGAAVGAAARAATRPDLAPARAEVVAMRNAGRDLVAFEAADVRFHLALAAASGNEAFLLVMHAVRHSMAAHLLGVLQALDDPVPTLEELTTEHEAILQAIERGHASKAEELVRHHVARFYA
jgi:GntR family transcriptional regulator, transcriptional repressor for pyruvate dehydrogenase complex